MTLQTNRRPGSQRANFALFFALTVVVFSASCGGASSNPFGGDDGGASEGGEVFGLGDDGGGSFDASSHPTPSMNKTINDCPGTVAAATVTALQKGSHDASMKWLYPYSGTVFPGGIAAPVLQWAQGATSVDAVYVHLHSKQFDYQGCFGATSPLQLQLPAAVWSAAWLQSTGAADPLTVELTTIAGGTVSGPITETWTFALGSLAGDVYYNTYASKIVPGQTGQNGAVIKIEGGQAKAVLYYTGLATFPFGPCVSCHSLSANGTTLVAQQHFYPGSDPLNGKGSMSFDLTMMPAPSPMSPLASTLNDDWGLSAVYPDGTQLLTSGEANDSTMTPFFPGVSGNNPGMIGPKASTMYNARTGAVMTTSGLSAKYAMMPMFSPDGKHIVYNDYDAGTGHTLTEMDFDVKSNTFSNARTLFHDGTKYPGWPFFTPDAKFVIFALGNTNNFASEEPPSPTPPFSSQLYVVSTSGGAAHRLHEASGYDSTGSEYLPFPGQDENLDFYPTVNPVASGGYYWAYFTSRRAYGNVYNKGSGDVGSKSIWVSAIDINATAGQDSSHPAFYLPGQELGTGNIRAFAVLAPCKGNGASCESGLDCCGGGCSSGKCAPPATCAGENDKCTDTTPCCEPQDQCLGGYCGCVAR
jgi:hypothetical protein